MNYRKLFVANFKADNFASMNFSVGSKGFEENWKVWGKYAKWLQITFLEVVNELLGLPNVCIVALFLANINTHSFVSKHFFVGSNSFEKN